MWPNPQETTDLVTFTEEILNRKLHFLCSETISNFKKLDIGNHLSKTFKLRSSNWAYIFWFKNQTFLKGITATRCSIKIGVLKCFANFTGKHLKDLCWSLFLIKKSFFLKSFFNKSDRNTGVLQWNLCNF